MIKFKPLNEAAKAHAKMVNADRRTAAIARREARKAEALLEEQEAA